MPAAFFVVRATVSDPAKRAAFDKWYQTEHLPDAAFVAPEGGYFLWVDLPDGTDVAALFDAAAARGVQFVKGTDFVLEGGESSLRLAYSGVTPAQIQAGVKRLAEAYQEVGSPAHAA